MAWGVDTKILKIRSPGLHVCHFTSFNNISHVFLLQFFFLDLSKVIYLIGMVIYRTVKHTTKTIKRPIHDFKYSQDFMICVICKLGYMAKDSFIKHSTFIHVQSSPSDKVGVSHLHIIDDA
jgi:hypothetical protein